MSDYIKRDAAIDAVYRRANKIMGDGYNPKALDVMGVAGLIRDIPSADVVEPKRGEWQYIYKGKWVFRRCSCCEWTQTYDDTKYMGYRYNFCPNCGADMRGADDE